jgi:hypothetical protein
LLSALSQINDQLLADMRFLKFQVIQKLNSGNLAWFALKKSFLKKHKFSGSVNMKGIYTVQYCISIIYQRIKLYYNKKNH